MEDKLLPKKNVKKAVAVILVILAFVGLVSFAGYKVAEKALLYPLHYTGEVERWSAEYGVDKYLVYAVIRTESSFDPEAESSAGARGLMQMTEDTFDWIKSRIAPGEALEFEALYQPEVAVRFGVYYLAICLERYGGDVATAAAAYHSGWGTVDGLLENTEYSRNGVTLESFPHRQMNHYVSKIEKHYAKYLRLYAAQ